MPTANRSNWVATGGIAALAMVGAVACSAGSEPIYPGMGEPGGDATSDGGAQTADDGGGERSILTVMNFQGWCSVTVNDGTASTAASTATSIATGSTVTIVATPASSSFEIGPKPWLGVTENAGGAAPGVDQGSGPTETSAATVLVKEDQCVSVCCQLPGNKPLACPTSSPCPAAF